MRRMRKGGGEGRGRRKGGDVEEGTKGGGGKEEETERKVSRRKNRMGMRGKG